VNKNILIVEDDETIRENLKELLEMEAYSVATAVHGKTALELLRSDLTAQRTLPFVILLDLNMPVMSGRDFIGAIRQEGQELSAIPIVVMTAVPNAEQMSTAGFLRKPIDLDELLSKIHSLCAPANV
jgi:CheY-like chemotaxis protein